MIHPKRHGHRHRQRPMTVSGQEPQDNTLDPKGLGPLHEAVLCISDLLGKASLAYI
jgi:hypothetical protein